MAVYNGGVEPSMRSQLRYRWQGLVSAGTVPEVLSSIMTMVRKDARRTDRAVKFYDGPDDNSNIRALFNILTTYAVNHQNVSYCQGMSDLLSPILYVMKKESEAYVCFCGLMQRMQANFKPESRIIKTGFRHLRK
ncbi:TBC1 domain family member 25 [Trichonephila clavata]|uniref:TBC1 domain family member 25 n=1 Tax=Trichonephila clavata TaxID=2740835 RepID=A0A8X6M5Q0_TRICU|nr:TBC1 domain family member 25 [Trichonephila clavata]